MMEAKEEIIGIINKQLKMPHYKIFFFGSRAAGTGTERSDIDVGIEAAEAVPAKIFFQIKDEMDNIRIMQKIDLVDFCKVSDEFKQYAMRDIKVIYEK